MHSRKSSQAPIWKKPSKSGTGPDSNCVEVAHLGTTIAIRDTKQIGQSNTVILQITKSEWTALTTLLAI